MADQLDMWGGMETQEEALPSDGVVEGHQPHALRPYQAEAVQASLGELENVNVQSTFVVMPTGSGKTRCATEIARRRPKDRILVLAHRDELIQQARERFAYDCDEEVGLDQAQFFGGDERIVIGSVQTVSRQARLERYRPNRFDLIITDEVHHGTAKSYRRIYDYFSEAKKWGCTATPDRADEKAMGMIADSVAYTYEIEDAIRDGYLCDVRCTRVEITGLDLSHVKTVAGDLNQGQLDAVMRAEKVLLGVADATIREAGTRPTIVFTTSVENADKMAEILRRHREGCAWAVNGKTNMYERQTLMDDFKAGKFQFLCNVGIATEGVDIPICSCISMARPTKSRAFYAQCVGRGLRPHPSKPNGMLILDFVGNSGRHRLCSALDALGGRYTDEEEDLAQEIVRKNPGSRARDALEQARAQMEERKKRLAEAAARKASVKAHAIYNTKQVDPFRVLHINLQRQMEISQRFGGNPATDDQLTCLRDRFKVQIPDGCTKQVASNLIGTLIARSRKHLATPKQLNTLQKYGVNETEISKSRASEIIGAIVRNGWCPLPLGQLKAMLHRQREPGEEG